MTSAADVPLMVLLPAVPTLVGISPLQVGTADTALTVVCSVSVLLTIAGSFSLPLTCAVLLIDPGALGVMVILTGALLAPPARSPMLQTTTPPDAEQPGEAEPNVAPAGSVSVRVIPVAALGPLLATITV